MDLPFFCFMNSVENIFLNFGLSWTISKLLPYLLAIVIGFVVTYIFRKKIKKYNPVLKWAMRTSAIVIPFMAYFIYAPIYEGDFSNGSLSVEKDANYAELKDEKLVIIALPNCPYCLESIERLKKLKQRVPEAEVEYVLCHADVSNIEWYEDNAGADIRIRIAEDSKAMSELAGGLFPTFVYVGKTHLKLWPNNAFGVLAMDELEDLLR